METGERGKGLGVVGMIEGEEGEEETKGDEGLMINLKRNKTIRNKIK